MPPRPHPPAHTLPPTGEADPSLPWPLAVSELLSDALGEARLRRMAAALLTPPLTTCLRVNTAVAVPEEIVNGLANAAREAGLPPNALPRQHPDIPEAILLPGTGPHAVDYAPAGGRGPSTRAWVPDRVCGSPTARGADGRVGPEQSHVDACTAVPWPMHECASLAAMCPTPSLPRCARRQGGGRVAQSGRGGAAGRRGVCPRRAGLLPRRQRRRRGGGVHRVGDGARRKDPGPAAWVPPGLRPGPGSEPAPQVGCWARPREQTPPLAAAGFPLLYLCHWPPPHAHHVFRPSFHTS